MRMPNKSLEPTPCGRSGLPVFFSMLFTFCFAESRRGAAQF
jgi:hypothetical protein